MILVKHIPVMTRRNFLQIIALLALLLVLLAEFWYFSQSPLLSDESFNFRQISRFRRGDLSMEPLMNVIPGYHALVALGLYISGRTGAFSARLISTGFSILTVLIFYLLTKKVEGRPSLVKTLQFAFFPLIFPFFPLIYTDILALLLVLLGFYLTLERHYTLAGLTGIASILARTNNISWFAFLFFFTCISEYGSDWRNAWRDRVRLLRHTWAYWLGFILFAAFLVVNRGIAIGDKSTQPLFKLETGNLYFLLFLFLFLFLPQNLALLPKTWRFIRQCPRFLVFLLLLLSLFFLTYHNTHPYNNVFPNYYLRNALLMAVEESVVWKLAYFLPVAISLTLLWVTPLQRRAYYWLYPFTLLSLTPFWLVEPRYYFVPLSLFILFRLVTQDKVEWITVGYNLVCALVLIYLIRHEIMFI